MRYGLTIAGAVLLGAWACSVSAAQRAADGGPPTVGEQYLFAAANAERAQRGLGPLQWDTSLYRAADFHAREMAARASISHQYAGEPELAARARQAGARFSVIAENVAEAPTAVKIHDAWMASEGHRANLLDPRVNAVGIRVLSRGGELYAVEDFSHTVQGLSLAEQESAVRGLLMGNSQLIMLPTTEDARRTCLMETGYSGSWKPWFVMRYTTADLSTLPDELRTQLAAGKYHQAQIAACAPPSETGFSSYRLAVMLFP